MKEFLEQVIAGVAAGGIYASLALALVLIYRAMGLINFAQGEFAMFTAFICFALLDGAQLPYALAVAITLVVGFVGGLGLERLVVRPFERGSPLVIVIVTLALSRSSTLSLASCGATLRARFPLRFRPGRSTSAGS